MAKYRKLTDSDIEQFEYVLNEVAMSKLSCQKICENNKIDFRLFWQKIKDDPGFAEKYARAKTMQAEYFAELMNEVVFNRDEDHTPFTGGNVVARDRLIADTLKFQVSKLLPKKYGDKIDVTSNGETVAPVVPEWYKSNGKRKS